MATTSRKTFGSNVKNEAVQKVLARELSVSEASQRYGLQPYQLYAWVGQAALSNPELTAQAKEKQEILRHTLQPLPSAEHSGIDPDFARAVGEWWIRRNLVSIATAGQPTPNGERPTGSSG